MTRPAPSSAYLEVHHHANASQPTTVLYQHYAARPPALGHTHPSVVEELARFVQRAPVL